MRRSNIFVAVSLIGALVAPSGGLLGAGPQISSEKITGIPRSGNARITASVPPGTAVSSARVYFRAEQEKTEYYLEMRAADGGQYWAILPRAASETKNGVYRIAVKDADGVEGSTPLRTVAVSGSTKSELTEEEKRYANNLVIGQTEPNVPGLPPGWECIGVISIITAAGELKPNADCRIAALIPPGVWVAAGAVAAGAVIVSTSSDGGDPVSPSRPAARATPR